MTKQSGIWIDGKKAIIVKLGSGDKTFKVIDSGIKTRERVPGEGQFGRFSRQFLSFDKTKKRKMLKQEKRYFREIIDELTDTEEIVLFGPAEVKHRLEKEIQGNKSLKFVLRGVEDADSMTDNQASAWVAKYYEK